MKYKVLDRPISSYMKILRNKGLRYCINELWKKIQRLHFIKDEKILSLQYEHKAYHQLSKYSYVLDNAFKKESSIPNQYPNKIWVSWLQGEENAPLLVKKCLASIKKHSSGLEVILLTEENIHKYVTFPDYILEKKKKNIISNTHFSDLLRIFLLAKYGGIWMDATVYLTGSLPDYILNAPLFCYKSSHLSPGKIKASNWFIAAERNQEIIVRTQDLLLEYWKHENRLIHYFIFHLLQSIAIDSLPHLALQWKQIPYYNNVNPHILLLELPDPYSDERFRQIKLLSPVHKLTWKISSEDLIKKGTFLQKLFIS